MHVILFWYIDNIVMFTKITLIFLKVLILLTKQSTFCQSYADLPKEIEVFIRGLIASNLTETLGELS